MLLTEQEKMREIIRSLAEKYGKDQGSLIPILRAIQKKYCFVSSVAMQEIADLLGIHPTEVYGVVTFYSFLSEEPQGKYIFRLCETISCDMVDKDSVACQLENDLGIQFGETSDDGMFTLLYTSCLGMCDQGPALMVNDKIFTRVTPATVSEIIEECQKSTPACDCSCHQPTNKEVE